MLLLTVTEFRSNISRYLHLATKEHIAVKTKEGIFDIIPSKEIRTNPSPSNDPWFDVPENMTHLNKAIEEVRDADISQLKSWDDLKGELGL